MAVADWVSTTGKNPTTVYITHGHGDHWFGLGAVRERFPGVRALATPAVIEGMRKWSAPEVFQTFWQPLFPGQIPDDNPVADPLDGPFFELEGRQLVAVNVGHADTWVWPLDSTTPASSKVAEVATAYFGLHRTALAYCMAMAAFVAADSRQLDAPRTRPATGDRPRALARSALRQD